MRFATVGCTLLVALGAASVHAQQPDESVSIEAIRQALRPPQPLSMMIPPTFTSEPNRRRLGILTLGDPDTMNGEMIRVVVPIGELTTGLARKVSSAQRQRRERSARETVERALRDFQAQRATK